MGEFFPILLVILFVVAIILAFSYKSHKLKTAEEQDVVTRFKVQFSRAKAKEIAGKITAAADSKDANPVVEFYEEGSGRLVRFEIT